MRSCRQAFLADERRRLTCTLSRARSTTLLGFEASACAVETLMVFLAVCFTILTTFLAGALVAFFSTFLGLAGLVTFLCTTTVLVFFFFLELVTDFGAVVAVLVDVVVVVVVVVVVEPCPDELLEPVPVVPVPVPVVPVPVPVVPVPVPVRPELPPLPVEPPPVPVAGGSAGIRYESGAARGISVERAGTERGDDRPARCDELAGAGPEDNRLSLAVAKVVGRGRDITSLEPARHRIDAGGPEDREDAGLGVEYGRLRPLGLAGVEIRDVVVGRRHGDKAGEVGRTADTQVEDLGCAAGLKHVNVPGAGPIDGNLVVAQPVIVAGHRNITGLAEVHGLKTADGADDLPHALAVDDRERRRLVGCVGSK